MRKFFAAIVVSVVTSSAAFADKGEFAASAVVGLEAATLSHPAVPTSLTTLTTPALLPRFVLRTSYGLTNDIDLSIALDAGVTTNSETENFIVGHENTTLVTGTYVELVTPFAASWRMNVSDRLALCAGTAAGPLLAAWALNAAVDSNAKGARRAQLPISVPDEARLGALFRVDLGVELRLFDVFLVAVEPHVAGTWSGKAGVRVGVDVALSWLPAVGPL